jgi:putative nucleotidyltransferase with HDIG domain
VGKTHETVSTTASSAQEQRPMTESIQEQTASQLALLQCLVESVSRSTDFLSALNMVLKSICEATGLAYGEAWVPSADGTHVTISPACYIGNDNLWPFRTVSEGYTFAEGVGLPGRILASRAPLWIDDVSKDLSYLRASPAKGAGLGAGFGIPILTRTGLAAILVFYETMPRQEDRNLIKLANSAAVQLGWLLLCKQTEDQLRHSQHMLEQAVSGTVSALTTTLEMRDPYTAGHARRVAELAFAIARAMDFTEDQGAGVRMAGYLHDVGKIIVPAEILAKPGKIGEYEFGIIKAHALAGHEILRSIEFPWPIAEAAFAHHERLDGSGYPRGLKGESIIVEARILSVADTVEAMASHRPYRPALGIEKAIEEIARNKGKRYDTRVADVCVDLFKTGRFAFT